MSHTELELRGELSKEKYIELVKLLQAKGKLVKEFKRFQLLYFEIKDNDINAHKDLKRDFRLRVENGQPLLIMKYGNWHNNSGREELNIPIDKSELDEMVRLLFLLGHDFGKIMIQHTKIFEYEGIEWAIVEAPGDDTDYYYYEAEIEGEDIDENESKEKILAELKNFSLSYFDDEEFIAFCKRFNEIKGRTFDFRENYNWQEMKTDFSDYFKDTNS